MTEPAPLLPPVAERTTLRERVQRRMLGDPDWGPMLRWLLPLIITTVAGVLRLVDLGHPRTLAFDETYYAKDAWSLWVLGYEGTWGDGANEGFVAGDTSALTATGSFIVHPPLGKWLIALGMGAFGPSSEAWRLVTALFGTATVLVVYLLARSLTRSTPIAVVASGLLAIDGLAIVMSRIALLDGILTFFVVLGFWFVVLDRRRTIPRIESHDPLTAASPLWGPILWRRPWVLAAGVALGAAAAVKWSGLYALAAVGLYLVVTDALARRRAGVVVWPADAAFRQGPVTFLLLVPIAAVVYLASWTGWLVTAGGYDRSSSSNPLVALMNYHEAMYGFHVGLSAEHSYASPAWQWPLLIRPTAVWTDTDAVGCGTDHCIATISTIPNPLIWYAGVAASVYLVVCLVRGLVRRQPMPWTYGIPLVGLAATYVPWLLYPERTIFQFYTVVMLPFLVLALALALRDLAGRPEASLFRRQSGDIAVSLFLALAVLVSAFYLPGWLGLSVPYEFWLVHNWMPSWI